MDDFSQLEVELRLLRPSAPSAGLTARVERALGQAPASIPTAGVLPRRPKLRVNWFALGFGVAAAAAFLMLARVTVDRPVRQAQKVAAANPVAPNIAAPTSTRGLVPDGVTRVVYGRSNEGLVFASNSDQPVRRVRSRSRETLQWKDPGTGASLRVSYPTEEIELIPVSGQ